MFSLRRAKTAPNFGVAPSRFLFVEDYPAGVLFDGLVLLEVPFAFWLRGFDDDPTSVSVVLGKFPLGTSAGVPVSDMTGGWQVTYY